MISLGRFNEQHPSGRLDTGNLSAISGLTPPSWFRPWEASGRPVQHRLAFLGEMAARALASVQSESFGQTAPAHSPNVTPKERPFAVSRPFAGLRPMIRIFAVPAAPQDGRAA
jgi:hypothetical protein